VIGFTARRALVAFELCFWGHDGSTVRRTIFYIQGMPKSTNI
jgi:hypothetical protein